MKLFLLVEMEQLFKEMKVRKVEAVKVESRETKMLMYGVTGSGT